MQSKITPATHPNKFALFDHGDYGTMYMKKSSLVKWFQLDRWNGIITLFEKGDNEEERREINKERKELISKMETMVKAMRDRHAKNMHIHRVDKEKDDFI